MKKKISLTDIAGSLNVSRTLVSMVLNGQGDLHGISAATQAKVKAKAKELNYKPNSIARGLRTGKSNTIGLIVTDISNSFYAKIARRIEYRASLFGYNLIFCSSDESVEREEALIQMLRGRQVDGLIMATTFKDDSVLSELINEEYPFVLIDRIISGFNSNYVVVDNYNSSMLAVERLIGNGHEQIGLLTVSPSHLSTIRDREQGYIDALKKHDLEITETNICEIPFNDIYNQVGFELDRLLRGSSPVTALYATNNNIAKACLEHLADMNLTIPNDVALLSYDDIDVFKFCNPPLTAVAQPIREISDHALDILLELITTGTQKQGEEKKIILSANMVVRKSCTRF
ncbi:MAG: LacI family transcriptional regulator [Saprospiraceae bacterium]|nr:LacI family transcriptional regulator [Saprospiraceae bacterium]